MNDCVTKKEHKHSYKIIKIFKQYQRKMNLLTKLITLMQI